MDIIKTPDEVKEMAAKRDRDTQQEISEFNKYHEIIRPILHTITSPIPHCDGWRGVFLSKNIIDETKALWATVNPAEIYEITYVNSGGKITSSMRSMNVYDAVADYDLIMGINKMIEALETKQELTDKRKSMRDALAAKLDDFRNLIDNYKNLPS